MTTKVENRSHAVSFSSDDGKFELTGIAASYNTPTDVGGDFMEQIAPGAFTRALREKQDVRILLNHNADVILGRTGAGTATLSDSPEGLRFVVRLDRNNSKHHEVFASVRRGDLDACSFAFKPAPNGERWELRSGKRWRTLTDLDLYDLSIVTYPQYQTGTSVSARNAVADGAALDAYHRKRAKEIEVEILRNAPGYRITGDLRVLPMTAAEVAAREDAEIALRVRKLDEQVRRDHALLEIEAVKKEMEN